MPDTMEEKIDTRLSTLAEDELDHLRGSLALEKKHFEERVQLLAGPFAKSLLGTGITFCVAVGFALRELLTSGPYVIEWLAAVVGLGVLTALAAGVRFARRKFDDLERVLNTAPGAEHRRQ